MENATKEFKAILFPLKFLTLLMAALLLLHIIWYAASVKPADVYKKVVEGNTATLDRLNKLEYQQELNTKKLSSLSLSPPEKE